MALPISMDDVVSAAEQLKGFAFRTPLIEDPMLNQAVGGRVFVKAECLQRTGSFKFRGAFNRISRLSEAEKAKGVVAFSSGNHAQGVARAASMLGVRATIVMPKDAPALKIERTRKFGGEIVFYDRHSESREAIAREIAAETGRIVVPSYNDPYIMAGQGTMGLEIAEELQTLGLSPDQILINCGGGGLASGSFTALRDRSDGFSAYIVEPENYDDGRRSLSSGTLCVNETAPPSVCDALLPGSLGLLPFEVLRNLNVSGLAVSDDEALAAVSFAATNLKLVAEPGGVVSLAALLSGKVDTKHKVSVCVISGGNVDSDMLCRAMTDFPC